mmetsp:Transcript_14863/g.29981  ORF Transcript_14863/g.29981 Transcript_14863/m.29981 type:complete len:81 (-) Transcript_14863:122-364(-)
MSEKYREKARESISLQKKKLSTSMEVCSAVPSPLDGVHHQESKNGVHESPMISSWVHPPQHCRSRAPIKSRCIRTAGGKY